MPTEQNRTGNDGRNSAGIDEDDDVFFDAAEELDELSAIRPEREQGTEIESAPSGRLDSNQTELSEAGQLGTRNPGGFDQRDFSRRELQQTEPLKKEVASRVTAKGLYKHEVRQEVRQDGTTETARTTRLGGQFARTEKFENEVRTEKTSNRQVGGERKVEFKRDDDGNVTGRTVSKTGRKGETFERYTESVKGNGAKDREFSDRQFLGGALYKKTTEFNEGTNEKLVTKSYLGGLVSRTTHIDAKGNETQVARRNGTNTYKAEFNSDGSVRETFSRPGKTTETTTRQTYDGQGNPAVETRQTQRYAGGFFSRETNTGIQPNASEAVPTRQDSAEALTDKAVKLLAARELVQDTQSKDAGNSAISKIRDGHLSEFFRDAEAHASRLNQGRGVDDKAIGRTQSDAVGKALDKLHDMDPHQKLQAAREGADPKWLKTYDKQMLDTEKGLFKEVKDAMRAVNRAGDKVSETRSNSNPLGVNFAAADVLSESPALIQAKADLATRRLDLDKKLDSLAGHVATHRNANSRHADAFKDAAGSKHADIVSKARESVQKAATGEIASERGRDLSLKVIKADQGLEAARKEWGSLENSEKEGLRTDKSEKDAAQTRLQTAEKSATEARANLEKHLNATAPENARGNTVSVDQYVANEKLIYDKLVRDESNKANTKHVMAELSGKESAAPNTEDITRDVDAKYNESLEKRPFQREQVSL